MSQPHHKPLSNPLLRNALAACANQISNFLPLLLTPILASRLGLSELGVSAVVLSLIQLSFVITDFGYTLSTTHRIAQNKDQKSFINSTIGAVLIGKIPLTLICIFITLTFPLIATNYKEQWPLFGLASIAIIGQSYQMNWLFQGLEKLQVVTPYMASTKLFYVLFVILFIHSPKDTYLVILGWGLAQFSAAILSLYSTSKSGYSIKPSNFSDVMSEAKLAWPFFISRIAVASYTSAATVLVGLSGQNQAACFYACQQVYKIGSALPVNQVLYPYMAKNKNWRVFYKITLCSGGLLFLIALTAAYHSNRILPILLGSELSGVSADGTFLIFLGASVVSYFAVAFGYPALCAVNALRKANTSVVYSAILNVIILCALYTTSTLSAFTAALSVLATELFVFLLRVYHLIQAK